MSELELYQFDELVKEVNRLTFGVNALFVIVLLLIGLLAILTIVIFKREGNE